MMAFFYPQVCLGSIVYVWAQKVVLVLKIIRSELAFRLSIGRCSAFYIYSLVSVEE